MQNHFRWAGLLLLLFLVAGVQADEKKNNNAKSQQTTQQDIQQLLALGEIRGKLTRVDEKDKSLTLEIEYQYLEFKGGNQGRNQSQNRANLMRQQQNAMRNRNPLSQLRQLQQIIAQAQRQQGGQNGLQVVKGHKTFELQALSDVKVRTQAPGEGEFDEKGNPKKFSPDELRKLKGPDASLPGYTSSFDKLMAGHIVRVKFARNQSAAGANKDKDDDLFLDDAKLKVSFILVQGYGAPAAEKKKKN